MVHVSAKYKDLYGVNQVPKRLKIKDGDIVEIFVERIGDSLLPSGTKIVRFREGKTVADTVEDMVKLRDYLLGVK